VYSDGERRLTLPGTQSRTNTPHLDEYIQTINTSITTTTIIIIMIIITTYQTMQRRHETERADGGRAAHVDDGATTEKRQIDVDVRELTVDIGGERQLAVVCCRRACQASLSLVLSLSLSLSLTLTLSLSLSLFSLAQSTFNTTRTEPGVDSRIV
jgi:hypothetical protein